MQGSQGEGLPGGNVLGWKDKKEDEDIDKPSIPRNTQPASGLWLDVQLPL